MDSEGNIKHYLHIKHLKLTNY